VTPLDHVTSLLSLDSMSSCLTFLDPTGSRLVGPLFLDSFHPYPLTRTIANVGHRCQIWTDIVFFFYSILYLSEHSIPSDLVTLLSCCRLPLWNHPPNPVCFSRHAFHPHSLFAARSQMATSTYIVYKTSFLIHPLSACVLRFLFSFFSSPPLLVSYLATKQTL
jgi:hypothetical protein